jgi:hypothetical protein
VILGDSPPAGIKKPPKSGVKKQLPLSYQRAVNYAGSNSDICFTDDSYTCLMGQSKGTYQKLPPPNPKWAWGRVIAATLRNTNLALATGLVRPFNVRLADPTLLKHGGYVYFTLATGSEASALLSIPDGLKTYAARLPSLNGPRDLFTTVFFPVTDPPASEDYATIFAEAQDYDDGWTKAVHCAQSQQLDHLQEGSDGPPPVKEHGIRIGWDDEQVAVWMNRQLDDSQTFDSPLGVHGYRVDVRVQGTTTWHSLVRAKDPIPLPVVTVDPFDGELNVEVRPAQQFAQKQGDFWLPMYFISWTGPPVVTADETMLRLLANIDLSSKTKMRGQGPDVDLRYGTTYEFRVRLADHTRGGPSVNGNPINPGPNPIGSIPFRRWIRPMAPVLVSPDPSSFGLVPDFENPPSELPFRRPRLAYPAVECTGGYSNAVELLMADIQQAINEKREPGLFDPDVVAVRITVEVAGFAQDPLATDAGYIPICQASKAFPSDPAALLRLSINWHPFDQLSDLTPDQTPTGPLILPQDRNIRLRIVAECKPDPSLAYFGKDDVCYGPNIHIDIGKYSTSELALFQGQSASKAINAFYFQPSAPTDATLITAQQAAGNPKEALSDLATRTANAFGLPNKGYTFYGSPGRRAVFACAGDLLHTLSPDLASITFSSQTDLALHWIVVIRLTVNRDWTWDGFAYNGITVQRDGVDIISFSPSRSIDKKILSGADRTGTDMIIFDTIDPKPLQGQFPQELNPKYRITSTLRGTPTTDPPLELSIRLPVTTQPSQTPKLVSAGLAMSPYVRSADYSTTSTRQRALWLEFDQPPLNPKDGYFARVLYSAPDPLLTTTSSSNPGLATLEPPLSIDAESVRKIIPNEPTDPAGLDAMQALIPAEPSDPSSTSTVHYLLPLPPGTTSTSPSLYNFYTYEFRLGHSSTTWSTARGRFGPALRVAGIQHPSPPLTCNAARTNDSIFVTAPFAGGGRSGGGVGQPKTTLWALLYAQASLIDGSDNVNVLVSRKRMESGSGSVESLATRTPASTSTTPGPAAPADLDIPIPPIDPTQYAQLSISVKEITAALNHLGFKPNAKLSVMAVELLPPSSTTTDPLGADLGNQRILGCSALVGVPVIC